MHEVNILSTSSSEESDDDTGLAPGCTARRWWYQSTD